MGFDNGQEQANDALEPLHNPVGVGFACEKSLLKVRCATLDFDV